MAMVSEMPPSWSPLVIFVESEQIPLSPEYMKEGFGLLWEWLFTRTNEIDSILLVPLVSNWELWERDYGTKNDGERLLDFMEKFRKVMIEEMQQGIMANIIAGEVINPGPPVNIYVPPDYFAINKKRYPINYLIPDMMIVGAHHSSRKPLKKIIEAFPYSARSRWLSGSPLIIIQYQTKPTSGTYIESNELVTFEELFG